MSQLNGGPISTHSYGGLSERLRRSGQLSSHFEEIQTLHSVVAGLQQEILQCNTQRKRATDQLACLISLVKNAWGGDKEASKSVGKIVGVSPPEIEVDYSLQDSARIVAKVKPNVINRWARLSMGLLNREYKKRELDIETKQRLYLHQRTSYLDHQMSLSLHHDTLHNTSTVSAPCLGTSGHVTTNNSRKGSANTTSRRPISRHLYRQPTPHSEEEPLDAKVCFGDLLVASSATRSQLIHSYPSQNGEHANQVWREKIERKTRVESEVAVNNSCNETAPETELTLSWASCRPPSGHYASPHRYVTNDIFDASSVILKIKADTPASRPSSFILKKPSFGRNIRPQSAVVVSNRPLKYETTRPLSAAPKPRPVFQKRNTEPLLRPKSSVNNSAREAKKTFDNDYHNNGEPIENHDSLRYSGSKESCRNESTTPLTSAEAFQEELKKMSEMENDFVKGTIDLQKRLGINAYGFVL